MKFLILSHTDDLTAMAVFACLRNRYGSEQVRLVSAEALIYAPVWQHQGQGSHMKTTVTLTDSSVITSDQIGVVFNRLRYAEPLQFAAEHDRQYARMELYALWLSWLESLPCAVINPAVPQGLGDRDWGDLEWRSHVVRAGLPSQNYALSTDPRRYHTTNAIPHNRAQTVDQGQSPLVPIATSVPMRLPVWYLEPVEETRHRVFVAGTKISGDPGADFRAELMALRRLTGCELLQLEFARALAGDPQPWRVTNLSAFPISLDDAVVDSMAQLLEKNMLGES